MIWQDTTRFSDAESSDRPAIQTPQIECDLSHITFQRPDPAVRIKIGPVELASRYTLAPLAGYTNLAFRMAVRACGGLGLATTDLVNCRGLLRGSVKTMELVSTVPEDRPLAVQIYGQDAGELRAAAQWLEGYGVTFIDINMGCPVHKV